MLVVLPLLDIVPGPLSIEPLVLTSKFAIPLADALVPAADGAAAVVAKLVAQVLHVDVVRLVGLRRAEVRGQVGGDLDGLVDGDLL